MLFADGIPDQVEGTDDTDGDGTFVLRKRAALYRRA